MSGVFDINAIANKFPASAETMLIDTRLTDEQEASCRVFRIYVDVPSHYHKTCDEYLFIVSGRGMDETGTVRNWAVEVSNPTDMTKRGWARSSFKVGDVVAVNLQPVKNGAPIGRLRSVVLPDGSTLTAMGAAPAAAPPAQ